MMSSIDKALGANKQFALDYDPTQVSPRPRLRLAVLTCMDTRLSRKALGLAAGDAHLIRNAGGIVTEDAIRSLLISHFVLGTQEFMVVNHTDCGLAKVTEDALKATIGSHAAPGMQFHAFTDVEQNVREQVAKLTSSKWVHDERITVRGFVFSVETGCLREVLPF